MKATLQKQNQAVEASVIKFPKTLEMLEAFRMQKGMTQSQANSLLDAAHKECKREKELTLFRRVMLHVGDISRQHELLTRLNIKSPTGGAQERSNFRKILKWWSENDSAVFNGHLEVLTQFTVYENLMYYQITTDRFKGNVKDIEVLFPNHEAVWTFLAAQIRQKKDLGLIARHLPKVSTGTTRTAKKTIVARKGVTKPFRWSFPEDRKPGFWLKLNGKDVNLKLGMDHIMVQGGDELTYPRYKQQETLDKQKYIMKWIKGLCNKLDWTLSDYISFRSTHQNTIEQIFSNKSILSFDEGQMEKVFNGMTSDQRYRVARMLVNKNGTVLEPVEKWGSVAKYYMQWESNQAVAAQNVRDAQATGDEVKIKQAAKQLKVKATGKQTIDLFADLVNSRDAQFINTTHTALVSKLDLVANVFPIIDGSASMNGFWGIEPIIVKDVKITPTIIARTLALTFSTLNPNKEFRNTYGWFSDNFHIVGASKYKDNSPNPYVNKAAFSTKSDKGVQISADKTFTDNLAIMSGSNPGEVSATNLWSVVDYFVSHATKHNINGEDLPNCLLMLTDTEGNIGRNVKEAFAKANSIGWNPLVIMWCIGKNRYREEFAKSIPNLLFVNGFSESVLSQVLRGIKSGSINPDDELYSIRDDKRYSVIS